jgi:ABC-2 type transport system permease protein
MSDTATRGVETAATPTEPTRVPSGGWRVIARKEFADHLLSARFVVLIGILGVAAAGAVYAASGGIRNVAPEALGVTGLFLKLFTVTTSPVPFPFVVFVGFLAPLLGIMFGFDAISGERSQGTLPRLLSHPIHRDEVIIGKFVAGLSVIGLMLTALTVFVSGIGIFRLGVAPSTAEVARLIVWDAFTVVYVGFWLAMAMLVSVVIRRASTSALVTVSIWLVLVLFGSLIFQALGSLLGGSDPTSVARAQLNLSRLSPVTLFQEVSTVLLDPTQRAVGLVTYDQVDRAVVSNLTVTQSLLVIWPQIVAMIAMTCVFFASAFVSFMRQEVRA